MRMTACMTPVPSRARSNSQITRNFTGSNLSALSVFLSPPLTPFVLSEQSFEFVYCQAGLPGDGPQRTSGHFFVVGHGDASVGWRCSSENDVAATPPILFMPDFLQCFHHLASGDTRQGAHTLTSTTSSVIGGGMGSPCASRLSRYAAMASLTFSTASSLVCPCEMR